MGFTIGFGGFAGGIEFGTVFGAAGGGVTGLAAPIAPAGSAAPPATVGIGGAGAGGLFTKGLPESTGFSDFFFKPPEKGDVAIN